MNVKYKRHAQQNVFEKILGLQNPLSLVRFQLYQPFLVDSSVGRARECIFKCLVYKERSMCGLCHARQVYSFNWQIDHTV